MPSIRHTARLRDVPLTSTLIAGLSRPEAYPHRTARIEVVETHISWVLLTGAFAYKVKKPVELGFLDFRTLEQRRFFCDEEVRLNRLWAPELYLEVVPIRLESGAPRIGGGPAVEYAVRMRQFDPSRRLDRLLEDGKLGSVEMRELAGEIARRHEAAERPGPAKRLLLATKRLMWENFDDLIGEADHRRIAALHGWTKQVLLRNERILEERCNDGAYRECHGDLHLGNLVQLPTGIRAFDCIEFSEELRAIDVVADYSFLVMDLVARGRSDLAFVFLNRYLEIRGDYAGAGLLPMYFVYRCLVRAKVAAIRRRERGGGAGPDEDTAALEHYSALAEAWTKRPRPLLVIMHGLSGSGKTWLSGELVAALPALRMRSDLERKRHFGLAEREGSRSGVAEGIYGPGTGDTIYEHLVAGARTMLTAGLDVILDAAFLGRERRRRARELAGACHADYVILRTTAPAPVLRDRLRQRESGGVDASEAGLAVLDYQLETQEALTEQEAARAITVPTDRDVDLVTLVSAIGHHRRDR